MSAATPISDASSGNTVSPIRVAEINSASSAVTTPAATARPSTRSGCPHGAGGGVDRRPLARRASSVSSRLRSRSPRQYADAAEVPVPLPTEGSTMTKRAFLEAAATATDLLADPAAASAWDAPSALPEVSVRWRVTSPDRSST